MATPAFDESGRDRTTFAPIELINCLNTEWKDVRLSFDDWDALKQVAGGDDVDGYYLNGYGVQCLAMACRARAGLEVENEGTVYDSEANTCFIHFQNLEDATKTAELLAPALRDRDKLVELVDFARENGYED